ncbi:hypothetical protein BB558_004353 [Smittium angustum]|uniref:Core-binding (CB) domain-containing protein n=1 Tax=Smittium angustum TaxID=133377 RepID=A0A2U1J3N1_SMIAN|nr:hypothetical protein BB558_004353 [Smittium angustum]
MDYRITAYISHSRKEKSFSQLAFKELKQPMKMETPKQNISNVEQEIRSIKLNLFASTLNRKTNSYFSECVGTDITKERELREPSINTNIPCSEEKDNEKSSSYTGGTRMAFTTMVPTIDKTFKESYNTTECPSKMENKIVVDRRLEFQKIISSKASLIIEQSVRKNTRRNYEQGWKKYSKWATEKCCNPREYNSTLLVNFLTEQKLKPTSASVIVTAVSKKWLDLHPELEQVSKNKR